MQVISEEGKVPIFSWCPDIEEGALEQMKVISGLPFVKHCALMPDAHLGMEMPIGGVVACEGVVVPKFVGVDIGCGMCAVETHLRKEQMTPEILEKLLHSFQRSIPVGFSHNSIQRAKELKQKYGSKYTYIYEEKSGASKCSMWPIASDPEEAFFSQLSTLGSGNHFIEVQVDEKGIVWVMIHSGSRNIGKKIGDYFDKVASELNRKYYSSVPEDIPFLPANDAEGKEYLAWMEFALQFAFLNRQAMLDSIKKDIEHVFPTVKFEKIINIHHNYASLENHGQSNVLVYRKGATLASKKTQGIIPGSMGTHSYIVKGLGNEKSLNSCSHGAGRLMGRMEFNRQNNTEEGMQAIKDSLKGVVHTKFEKARSRKGKETGMMEVSEAPGAYKDIESVMSNQIDLVQPVVTLTPIMCMKG